MYICIEIFTIVSYFFGYITFSLFLRMKTFLAPINSYQLRNIWNVIIARQEDEWHQDGHQGRESYESVLSWQAE